MNILAITIITVILFLLTIVTGIWLGKSGKPLNKIIFTIHKLLALWSIVFVVILSYRLYIEAGINSLLFTLSIINIFFAFLLFVTGSLLSFEKISNKIILGLHKSVPLNVLLLIFIILYIIFN